MFIVDFKFSGKYVMEDLYKIGGVFVVLKYLLEKGLIDGSCMIVMGKIIVENFVECLFFFEG